VKDNQKNDQADDFVFDKRLYIIFLISFTEVLGFSMVLPLIPYLGKELGLTLSQIGLIISLFSVCQLFASPITGKLSDHFGRKPLFILSQISTFVGFIFLGFATTVVLLIAARLIDGLLGSNMTVSQAYISDITEPKHRTRVYSYSSGVFGAGLIFGPFIGGILSTINYSVPMFFAAAITLISIALVILFLPETIPKKTEKISLSFNDVIPVDNVKHFVRTHHIRSRLLMFFIYTMAFFLFISNLSLLGIAQFHITAEQVSFYMVWIGLIRVGVQTVLIARILRFFGENRVLLIGVFSMIISMVTLIFSTEYLFVFVPLVFLAFGTGVGRPILTSRLTNSVTQKETGAILGVNNALTSVAQIIAPIFGGFIIEYLAPQTLPLLSAIIFTLLILFLRNTTKNNPDA
jgi:DHA1 family tetracycline resistance protein-like MFS transporter